MLRILAPPLGLMLFNFILSSIPGTTDDIDILGFVPPQLQNLLHLPFYGLLAWLWHRSLCELGKNRNHAVALAILFSIVWGLLDEIHQYFVPGRYASLTDLALNTTGILMVGVYIVMQNQRQE